MTDATASRLIAQPKGEALGSGVLTRGKLVFFSIGAALFAGASALWWRFGEGVFAQSIMNAIIACF